MNDEATIKAVQQRMQQVRFNMGDEVEDLVESAKDITDWRQYVRASPWACVAAAAALGYVIVPKRAAPVRLDNSELRSLFKEGLAPSQRQHGGLGKALFSFVASAAVRSALGYLGQRLARANMPMESGEDRPF